MPANLRQSPHFSALSSIFVTYLNFAWCIAHTGLAVKTTFVENEPKGHEQSKMASEKWPPPPTLADFPPPQPPPLRRLHAEFCPRPLRSQLHLRDLRALLHCAHCLSCKFIDYPRLEFHTGYHTLDSSVGARPIARSSIN